MSRIPGRQASYAYSIMVSDTYNPDVNIVRKQVLVTHFPLLPTCPTGPLLPLDSCPLDRLPSPAQFSLSFILINCLIYFQLNPYLFSRYNHDFPSVKLIYQVIVISSLEYNTQIWVNENTSIITISTLSDSDLPVPSKNYSIQVLVLNRSLSSIRFL